MSDAESEFDFDYTDCDAHPNELAELYSYAENYEFSLNQSSFEELLEEWKFAKKWKQMGSSERGRLIEKLSEGIELSDKERRFKCLRAVLYVVQGIFADASAPEEILEEAERNVFLIHGQGFFPILVQLLSKEIETKFNQGFLRLQPINMDDSAELRVILNIIYIILEVMREKDPRNRDPSSEPETETEAIRRRFQEELCNPISSTDELLALTLFQMTTKFCNGSSPHFPIKKVLLCLWKTILITLGGMERLRHLKQRYRERVGLEPERDTISITRTMRPVSPPVTVESTLVSINQKRRKMRQKMMIKQDAMIGDEQDDETIETNGESDQNKEELNTNGEGDQEGREKNEEEKVDIGPRPASPGSLNDNKEDRETEGSNRATPPRINRCLHWKPKVRYKDIDLFLYQARTKFLNFDAPENREATAGLPEPILEGLKVLKKHLYISLADLQMRREEEIAKYPLTVEELDEEPLRSPAEALYISILPSLPQYMIALLKILLAAAPTSKSKAESMNIGCEILREATPTSVLESMKSAMDFNRHKEIIIKAVSAVLILLLKHFKINHIYQFENISQQLMFANCIPLILKIFNQNILQYVTSRNNIDLLAYPVCLIGEPEEKSPDWANEVVNEFNMAINEIISSQNCTWRNMFSCINMARILNKLTKWKYARTMMLVVFKSSPIFKKALRVRHATFQLYILKLLKMQTKYLGRQWRKGNMRTLSCIYQMVRHRLTDDWAFGNEMETKPWDFQNDEINLQTKIGQFHNRRYNKIANINSFSSPQINPANGHSFGNSHFNPYSGSFTDSFIYAAHEELFRSVDNNYLSVLSQQFHLTNEFKNNYETWLEREVFQFNIDWDQLLIQTSTPGM